MAIIESLSLAAGGGVISSASQSKQKEDVVNIFIGLGGTGTDAIRSIKKQVYERLIPDNVEEYDDPDSKVSTREFKHIKFLSIDTDQRAYNVRHDILDKTEKMDLSLNISTWRINTDHRPDLKWFHQEPQISDVIPRSPGPGGIRQAGRYLLFDKIDSFEAKVIQFVDEAKVGITGDCKVVVHIFSGISGGTGSGIFLDVCYAVKKALSGIANKMVVGYFFLPDINLSVKGLDAASCQYIPKNAYAALQELNYCMGIPNNGGSFRQIINDGTYIDWNQSPVDMCHIIGAQTERLAKITDNAYDYAMYTVTEYVMNFISNNMNDDFDFYAMAAEQGPRIAQASAYRTSGYNPCMVSLGVACACIPFREINTYLVSGVFEEYGNKHTNDVTRADAEDAINKAWNVTSLPFNTMVDKIYASLLKKLSGNDSNGLQGYNYYKDPDGAGKPWDFLLDTVNSNGENDLEAFYLDALNKHIGNLAANADKLTNQGFDGTNNKESLIYLLDQALDSIVKDINRGPQFAKNIIDFVEGANVLNLIAGLKAKNKAEYQSVEKNRDRNYEDYLETKRIFFNRERQGLFDNNKKRYQDFENCVVAYVQLIELVGGVYSTNPNVKPMVGVYGQISNVLDALENQIKERIKNYYEPLSYVLLDLTDTFQHNLSYLSDPNIYDHLNGFSRPLVSIYDEGIKTFLDNQNKNTPTANMFSAFMTTLIDAGYDVWQKREERLPKTIQSFFFGWGGVFRNISNMTVDSFLEKKYGFNGVHLEQTIIKDYFGDLINASSPLLPVIETKLDGQRFYKKLVSFPHASSVISNALTIAKTDAERIPSSTNDRVLFIQIRDGIPLQAYTEIEELENQYYSAFIGSGSHLYEENGIYDDMPFSDWRDLPSISVPSVLGENIPDKLKSKVDTVRQLFDKAVEYGIIKINCPFDNAKEDEYRYLYDIPESLQNEINELNVKANTISNASELETLKFRINELLDNEYKKNLVRSEVMLKQPPYRTDAEEYDIRLKFDFFYLSPVYQLKVKEIIKKIDSNLETLKQVAKIIEQKTVQ